MTLRAVYTGQQEGGNDRILIVEFMANGNLERKLREEKDGNRLNEPGGMQMIRF